MSSPSDLRKRAGNGIEKESPSSPTSRQTTPKVKTKNGGVGVMDILRIVGGLFLLNCLLSYFITNDSVLWGYRPWFVRPAVLMRYLQGPVSLTDAELLAYDGTDPNKPIYVALNGTIYDVTAGSHVYGPGGSYHVFAGKDSARAFITGCFAEDTTADLRGAEWTYISVDIPDMDAKGVTPEQKKLREQVVRLAKQKVQTTIDGWASMFKGEGGKDYFEAGTVKRDPDWLEKTPMRKLCDQAQKSRPKSKNAGNDAGAAYRGN